MKGSVTGSDPAAMIACSKLTILVATVLGADLELVHGDEPPVARHHGHLALLGEPGQAAREPLHHAVLPATQLVDVDSRLRKADPVGPHAPCLVDDLGGVQERLGGDAAYVQAHAPKARPAVHQHDLLAQIRGPEGGGIAARPCPEHQHLGMEVSCCGDRWLRELARAPWPVPFRPGPGLEC